MMTQYFENVEVLILWNNWRSMLSSTMVPAPFLENKNKNKNREMDVATSGALSILTHTSFTAFASGIK
jgi:hypothetical protein